MAYPSQGHEMLFDAHTRSFTALGGVARRGIYDNMKTAVDKVLKRREKLARALAEGFVYQGEPSAHHGGEPRGTPSGLLPKYSFVGFLQNHDQIGNRAFGERLATLTSPEQLDAAMTLLLMAPHIPMLFMGDEIKTTAPFHYFADYEGDLAESIRQGRKLEFAGFGNFGKNPESIPDPISPETFEQSKIDILPRTSRSFETLKHTDLVRTLLVLRSQLIVPRLEGCETVIAEAVGASAVFAEWRLNDDSHLCIYANLGNSSVRLESTISESVQLLFESRDGTRASVRAGTLPEACAVVWIEPGNVESSRVPVIHEKEEQAVEA